MDVAKKFGMIQAGSSTTQAVRAVFIIDPESVVRTILIIQPQQDVTLMKSSVSLLHFKKRIKKL